MARLWKQQNLEVSFVFFGKWQRVLRYLNNSEEMRNLYFSDSFMWPETENQRSSI